MARRRRCPPPPVPLLPGRASSPPPICPRRARSNMAYLEPWVSIAPQVPEDVAVLLRDAQTSGGLLLALPSPTDAGGRADPGAARFAAVIGQVIGGAAGHVTVGPGPPGGQGGEPGDGALAVLRGGLPLLPPHAAAGIRGERPLATGVPRHGEILRIREISHVWPVPSFPDERNFPVNPVARARGPAGVPLARAVAGASFCLGSPLPLSGSEPGSETLRPVGRLNGHERMPVGPTGSEIAGPRATVTPPRTVD